MADDKPAAPAPKVEHPAVASKLESDQHKLDKLKAEVEAQEKKAAAEQHLRIAKQTGNPGY